MTERRHNNRAEFNVLVNNTLLAKVPVGNVSEEGICFTTDKAFAKGDFLVLDFTLPGNIEIKAYGKVKWQQQEAEGVFLNGLEFWHIEDEYKEKLAAFVKKITSEKRHMPC